MASIRLLPLLAMLYEVLIPFAHLQRILLSSSPPTFWWRDNWHELHTSIIAKLYLDAVEDIDLILLDLMHYEVQGVVKFSKRTETDTETFDTNSNLNSADHTSHPRLVNSVRLI